MAQETTVKYAGTTINSYLADYEVELMQGEAVGTCDITCVSNLTDAVTPTVGQRIEIWRPNTDKIFDGTLEKINYIQGGKINLEGRDKLYNLVKKLVNEVYTDDGLQGGVISEIWRDIVVQHGEVYAGPFVIDAHSIVVYPLQHSDVLDYSNNNHHADAVTAVTAVAGQYGVALDFNGTSSEIEFGAVSALNLASFTVECWVKQTALSAGTIAANSVTAGGANSGWVLKIDGSGNLQLTVANASGTATATSSTAITTNTWYHVAGSYNGTTIKVFVGGTQTGSQALTGPATYTGVNFRIGSLDGGSFFDGSIDEVRVSDSVLTTFVYTDSVVSTGTATILKKWVCRRADPMERCKALANSVEYQFYFKSEEGRAYFEPVGNTTNVNILTVGTEVVEMPKWVKNANELINDVYIYGSYQEVETTELFSGDASSTDFTLTFMPESTKVYVGGVLKQGDVEGSSFYDYYVDKTKKMIKFTTAPGSGTNNIEVRYSYYQPTPVHKKSDASITAYTSYEKYLNWPDIKRTDDAEVRGQKIIDMFAEPFYYSTIKVQSVDTDVIKVGQNIRIIDGQSSPTVDAFFPINKITLSWPSSYDEMDVGQKRWREEEWNNTVDTRLKRLEESGLGEDDIILELVEGGKSGAQSIHLRRKQLIVRTHNIGSGFIWNHPTNSVWNAGNLWNGASANNWVDVVNTTYY